MHHMHDLHVLGEGYVTFTTAAACTHMYKVYFIAFQYQLFNWWDRTGWWIDELYRWEQKHITENSASTTEGNFKMLFRALATSIFINLSWIIFMMQAQYSTSVYKLRTKLLCYSWWNWQAIQENGFPRSSWHDGFALHWHSRICFY